MGVVVGDQFRLLRRNVTKSGEKMPCARIESKQNLTRWLQLFSIAHSSGGGSDKFSGVSDKSLPQSWTPVNTEEEEEEPQISDRAARLLA